MSNKVTITRNEVLEKALEDYRKDPEKLPDLLIRLVKQVTDLNFLVQPFIDLAFKEYLTQQSQSEEAKVAWEEMEERNEYIKRKIRGEQWTKN